MCRSARFAASTASTLYSRDLALAKLTWHRCFFFLPAALPCLFVPGLCLQLATEFVFQLSDYCRQQVCWTQRSGKCR